MWWGLTSVHVNRTLQTLDEKPLISREKRADIESSRLSARDG